jgi:phage terminase large subunit
MSQEWDMIYANELTELFQSDYEALLSRLRYGNMPYQQLLFDCNPGPPNHWVKALADSGDIIMWPSRHQDNPVLWDFKAGTWTEQGAAYIAKLDKLTGVRKLRLRYGQWAAAEGMVYDNFDRDVNVINRFPIPAEWRKWRVVDFGYEHPFVCQWWAEDPDGRLYLYRELYGVHRLVEDWARKIKIYSRYDGGYAGLITDHDAEDRATLEKYLNEDTIPADKRVSVGIQSVQSRLRRNADGKPRLFFFIDALVERSEELDDDELPVSTLTEIEGYVWERGPDGKTKRGERPVKDNDHGMDAMRYMVMHLDNGLPEVDAEIQRAIDAFYS